jgi:hypothetical protein
LGKQVFVLISGYDMFGSENKEDGRQVGHQEEHGRAVDMALMFGLEIRLIG